MKVGILGGGQLGRMLALAGYPLGLRFRFMDPAADAPAGHLAECVGGAYDDLAALDRFAEGLDAVTYEFENVPVAAAKHLAAKLPVYPPPGALDAAQDRLTEKTLFNQLGIGTPPFEAVQTEAELKAAAERIGLPAVFKTRRMGYDGKGQAVLRDAADVEQAWKQLGGTPLILEGFVRFERELSILGVRAQDGATAFYPLAENHHRDGILRLSLAPAPDLTPALQAQAEALSQKVLDRLQYVGVLAIELFQVNGTLLANEMAPRVHNSGHWTIEGAACSQFENHLRAVCGLPLGGTAAMPSAMLNLIGSAPPPEAILAVPGAHFHWYGKDPRPGRKIGHVTLCEQAPGDLAPRLEQLKKRIP
ncbi:MAG: 5-(carboxyamino)imidazole ribonucleotide synthase [Planctomycetota bacterium]|nr:5-(carboxyamino)imidazole ribonucleotide synthase [Planctomycetota bacterium]